ncbi:MAG: tetratricopeptide repeat protein [Myxococcaceae bacterium]|nr:tetratricopeptide repeat protein [Myxococcaceae bacterium]
MDKNKIIEAAGKLVAKGAYDKAIKEYQKVLEVDPKDVRILQKMGELYQKKNDNVQAAAFIMKVAESYAKDGFFLKAVAQYKQVLKLDPSLVDINIQLAELHQQLQLMGEAMAYYQIVANHYDKQGDVKKSLDVLRKMVDLDPDNVQSRVKLADLYIRERMNDEATAELQRAAEHLKRQNRTDDYLRVAEKISALTPDDLNLARELAETYLSRNDQKRALAKLQVCFKANPRDIDTLRLLGVAFQGLGQTSKTISVYKELARAYAERGQTQESENTWAQVAQLDPNDPDVLARSGPAEPEAPAPPMPVAPQRTGTTGVQQPFQPAQAATQAAPAHVPAPRTGQTGQQAAFQPPAPQAKPRSDSLGKLLTETDVYVKYGLHDKALEHLRKVFAVEPENIDAHEKAYAIYVASNNHAQAAEQLLNVLRLHTRLGDRPRAQPFLASILQQNPGHPEVPVFLQALRLEGGTAAVAEHTPQAEVAEDAILVDSSDDEVIVADEPVEEPISAEVAISSEEAIEAPEYVPDDMAIAPDDAALAAAVEVEPPPVGDAYPEAEPVVADDEAFEPPTSTMSLEEEPRTGEFEAATAEPLERESDFDQDVPTHGTGIKVQAPAEPASAATRQAPAYVPQAALSTSQHQAFVPPEPEPTFESPFEPPALGDDEHEAPTRAMKAIDPSMLKTASGYRSGAVKALQAPLEVEEAPAPLTGPSATMDEDFAPQPPAAEEPIEAPPAEEPASEECDEATFFVEQGLYDEAREILETVLIAYPDHQRAAQLLAHVDAAQQGGAPPPAEPGEPETLSAAPAVPPNGESKDAFDLAQELADELGDFGGEAEPAPAVGGDDDYQVSVEEVFAEFKKGLEKVVKPEDVDTHYDLGIAYKEMGLVDDAISEFTIARKGCVGKKKEIDCLTMAGLLQVMKGDFPMAVDSFLQALTSEHATGEVEKATRFELAGAYEGAGQAGRALAQYLRVQASDPSYREVGAMVDRLSAIAVPEDDPEPPGGGAPPPRKGGPSGSPSRKVGYV